MYALAYQLQTEQKEKDNEVGHAGWGTGGGFLESSKTTEKKAMPLPICNLSAFF